MPHQRQPTIGRRAFLLAGGSALVLASGAPAIAAPSAPQRIRPNEKIFVDLSAELAGLHDGSDITLAVNSPNGVLTAHVWLGKSLSHGQAALLVKRELLDHFVVEAKNGQAGAEAGSIMLRGFEGPNGTGQEITRVIPFACDSTPPATWAMGALTRAQFGGLAIHQYFPGDGSEWSIRSQTRPGQFEIRRDPANNQHRLVLAGPEGGPPTMAPNPGGTADVTLARGAQTHKVRVDFVPLQVDCAPWPATDNPGDAILGSQLGVSMRNGMSYGNVFMMEDGDYPARRYQPGFTTTFGVTTISTAFGAPSGPYEGDSWDYRPNPKFNPKLISIQARSPHGAYLKGLIIDVRSLRRSANPIVGFRLTNLRTDIVNFYDGATVHPDWDLLVADHLILNGANETSSLQLGNNRRRHKGMIAVANWVRGNLNISGTDIQIIGNRIEKTERLLDACNYASVHQFADKPRSVVAFNTWINNAGQDSALHADLCALAGDSFYSDLEGPQKTARFYGNIIWGGRRRMTAKGEEAIGGQCFFFGNITGGVFHQVEFSGNIVVEISRHGNTVTRPASGSTWRYNMLLFDHAVTRPMAGATTPVLWFRGSTNDAASMRIERNIMESGGYAADAGITPPERNNVWKADRKWQASRLVNPRLGGGAEDVGDIVRALAFKPGARLDAGPLSDPTLIDHRRHTADLRRLFE